MASIFREVGETLTALVQGFSVTFRTMFRKTVTENYPFEPVHFQPRYRGIHVLHRDESGLENVWAVFSAPQLALRIASISKRLKTRMLAGFPRASATPAFTISIILAAFSVAIAWKLVQPTRSRMGTVLN